VTLHALRHSFATHLLERRGTTSNLSAAQQADIQAVIAETFRFAFLSIAAFTTFAFSSRCRSRCAAFRTAPARRGLVGCADPQRGGDIMPSCTNAHWATSPTPAVRPRARERSRPIRSRAAPALRRGWKPRHISFRVGAEDAPYLEQEFQERFDRLDVTQLPNYRIYLKLMIDGTPSNPFSAVTLRPY
jgi:hypothetical protein